MKKIVNLVLIVLLIVAALSVILWLVGVVDVDMMLYVAYAYIAIAVLLLIGMTAMNMGKSKGNSKIGLYVFGGLAVLAVVFWFALAKAIPVTGADGTVFDVAFTLKMTDTMLYLAYFSMAAVVLFLLVGEVRKALK